MAVRIEKGGWFLIFLIGAGLSRNAIAKVGARPLILGDLLWIANSCTSLYAVLNLAR